LALAYPFKLILLIVTLLTSLHAIGVSVKLSGLENARLIENITAHLAVVDPPLNCHLSEDYTSRIDKTVDIAAQALGYYHVTLNSLGLTNKDNCEGLSITVLPGKRVTIRNKHVELLGEGQNDLVLMAQVRVFPLAPGDSLEHAKYDSAKRRLRSLALQRGYFDAAYQRQQIQVDVQSDVADLELVLITGSRYQFGEMILPPGSRALALIEQVRPFVTGDDYHSDLLAKFNQNLKLTDYFQQIVARPLVKDAVQNQVPIEVIMTNKPKDIYNLGGGASTDTGPRVRAKWQRPWVNTRGHSISAELFYSVPQQSLSIKYKVPLEDPLDNYLSFQAGFKAENDNDTRSENYTFGVQRHWGESDNSWKKIAFVRYELEQFQQGANPSQNTQLLLPGATLSRRRSRGGLDVHWGDAQQLTLEAASENLVSDIDLARLSVQSTWLRSMAKHRLLVRGEFGAIATSDFEQVPSSLRYFAGGDQSVRGFGYQTLSPVKDGQLSGGKYLNVLSAEYSYPLYPDWRLAIFSDMGNASNEPFENLASGVGMGVSWLSPVGPIRLYLARGNSDYEQTWRLHFTMGPTL
jgi:translocation and assembly module TamA